MSRNVGNHVLERVHHLVNRIVVFLQYCVFSCIEKLLQPGAYLYESGPDSREGPQEFLWEAD